MRDRVTTFPFAGDFIEELALVLDKEYIKPGKDMARLALVFEGRRPALFLRRALSRRIGKSFCPPVFFEIDEFVAYAANKNRPQVLIADLEASFIIYELSRDISPALLKGRSSFAQFLPWAREILSFIDQLDLEDIGDDALRGLEAKAEIGYEIPPAINAILKHVIELRREYHKKLAGANRCSQGMLYRNARAAIDTIAFDEFDELWFSNVLAYQKAQTSIMESLYRRGIARLFFQGDQDSWPVLKNIASDFKISITPERRKEEPRDCMLYEAFDAHSEVSVVGEILRTVKDPGRTVILAPDTGTVVPLISEIAASTKELNISMGYPVKRSSLYVLFELIRTAQEARKGSAYYTRDYLGVMRHPLVKNTAFTGDPQMSRILAHTIEELLTGSLRSDLSGNLFIKLNDIASDDGIYSHALAIMEEAGITADRRTLKQLLGNMHRLFFADWEDITDFRGFAAQLEAMCDTLVAKSLVAEHPLDLMAAKKMFSIIDDLKAQVFSSAAFSREEIFLIAGDIIGGEKIRFTGSPLKGLQVLGLWESRLLSFDTVIVIDAHDAVLPKLRIYEPLIPREVMAGLGLKRPGKEEEIQRYHFMRLAAGARELHVVYVNDGKTERSRFVEEIIWQRQKASGSAEGLPLVYPRFSLEIMARKGSVAKTPAMVEHLSRLSFSATSIDTYTNCPRRFYFRYVLKLKEKKDILGDPEARDMGDFIHELLFQMFSAFKGKAPVIDGVFRKQFFKRLDTAFRIKFARRMRQDALIMRRILIYRLKKFLASEEERSPLIQKILFLEETFRGTIKCKRTLNFEARLDRVDKLNDGSVLIVDYKTGGQELMPKGYQAIKAMPLTRPDIRRTVKSFQLPLYLYAFRQLAQKNTGAPLDAALYYLRTSKLEYFFGSEDIASGDEIVDVFMAAAGYILNEILDVTREFAADDSDVRYCGMCPYGGLCR
ncbi:MAG: PD-(D/E)XK nuclease family protein [Candidatus Omnitrophica bacterium]|nr:PD-(D/E)XK nuclease family protein [Candidatus Omnitrophota bacterium]